MSQEERHDEAGANEWTIDEPDFANRFRVNVDDLLLYDRILSNGCEIYVNEMSAEQAKRYVLRL